MPKQEDSSGWTTSTRGDSAWKEAREAVAARNAETSKVGKAARETYEKGREAMKRAGVAKRGGNVR